MPKYNVALKTGNKDGAGTNADVAIELRGQKGRSGWIILDWPGQDDRERNDTDRYGVALAEDLGDVTEVAFLLRDADGNRPDWFLSYVQIFLFDGHDNHGWQFDLNGWIKIAGKTEWFEGPVLDKRSYKGPFPNMWFWGPGGLPAITGSSLVSITESP